jgi:hypothetical protein
MTGPIIARRYQIRQSAPDLIWFRNLKTKQNHAAHRQRSIGGQLPKIFIEGEENTAFTYGPIENAVIVFAG